MEDLPRALEDYVLALTLDQRGAAYILMTREGIVQGMGGALARYGVDGLEIGSDVLSRAEFLQGLLPPDEDPHVMRYVQTPSGCHADVHLVRAPEGAFALLLDSTDEVQRQTDLQQKGNDLDLLRQRMGSDWAEVSVAPDDRWTPESVLGSEQAKRVPVTAVAVRFVCEGLEDPSWSALEQVHMHARCLAVVRGPLLRESALIQPSGGQGLLAVFGVLPSTGVAARQAVEAAADVRAAVDEMETLAIGGRPLLAMGVASGPASIGAEGDAEQARLLVLGRPVNRAWELAAIAAPDELLADRASIAETQGLEDRFGQHPAAGRDAFLYRWPA